MRQHTEERPASAYPELLIHSTKRLIQMHQKFPDLFAARARRVVAACVVGAACWGVQAQPASAAATLRGSYAALGEQLRHNQFGQPLVLDSAETPDNLRGDIFAVVEHPFATVSAALNDPGEWCDVLILHLNTKYCRTAGSGANTAVNIAVGKKFNQPLKDAHRVDFAWRPVSATADYLEIHLEAPAGPLGTSDYRIVLQAIPLEGGRSFIHLRYSYSYGFAGRMAMKAYLATIGSDKIGFTSSGKGPDGKPAFIGGVRGVAERNTMRYYLAIDAYLDALSAPADARLERRLQNWFTATERYARQLHEMERSEYIAMKLVEYRRQQQP